MKIPEVFRWSAADMYGYLQATRGMFEIIPDTPFDGDAKYEGDVKIVAAQLALDWDSEDLSSRAFLRTIAALWVEKTSINYADLGVPLVDGKLPLVILAEHMFITAVHNKVAEKVRSKAHR